MTNVEKLITQLQIIDFKNNIRCILLYCSHIFRAIYKTRNTGTGNGIRGMRETRGMFTRFPGNLLEDSGESYYFNIPGNVEEDSGECSTRFRGVFPKIPGNDRKDSRECSRRFRGMLKKIPGNVRRDSEECFRRFRGMFEEIPGNARKDSGEYSKRFRGMLQKIPGNVSKDSGECWQRFSRMLKKIESFIMQLNENRIKQYILKYYRKCAQMFIKTSHVNKNM